MASHVSDTERAIFWTKWRFQQCYRNTGNSENLGIVYKNTTVKKKLIILATISVFILFFLKTRLQMKPDEPILSLETLEEDYSFDEKPENDFKNKINVNEQQDRIKAEKFEVNNLVGGFGDEKLTNDIDKNNGFGEDVDQDGKIKNGAPIVPVLEPPSDIKDKVVDSFDIKLNDQVPRPEIKGENDTKTVEGKQSEGDSDQKKKIQEINEVDQKLKAGEKKKKKIKTVEEKDPENDLDQKKKIQDINELDQDLEAGEKKKKKTKPETIGEKNPESNTDQEKKIQDTNEVDQDIEADEKKNKKKKHQKVGKSKKGKKKDKKKKVKESDIINTFPSEENNATIMQKDMDIDFEKKGMEHIQNITIDSEVSGKNENIETTIEIVQSLENIASYMNGTENEAELLKGTMVDDEIETKANLSSNTENIVDDNDSEGQNKNEDTKRKNIKDKKKKLKSNEDSETEEEVESKQNTHEEVDYSETKDKKRKKKIKGKNRNIKGEKKASKKKHNQSNKNDEAEETSKE